MESALRIRANVLPGKRIEITSPELPEGGTVDVIVLVPQPKGVGQGVLDYLDSLPPSGRTPEHWAERERELQEDRDSWDR